VRGWRGRDDLHDVTGGIDADSLLSLKTQSTSEVSRRLSVGVRLAS
jgi:hypothetical protein